MKRLAKLLVTLLALSLSSELAVAEDSSAEQGEDYSLSQNNTQSNGGDGGYYNSEVKICSDAVIQVQDIIVYCDSPGTFYYGSGKYRNSQTCQPGDKATVQLDFYIASQNTIQQAGNKALIDIYATGGSYTEDVQVYDSADLCSLSSLTRKSRSQCPYNGYYQVKTHFYWGSGESETFVPTITVGFKSSVKKSVYDFGGANTDLCRGSTFVSWSEGVRVQYANAMGTFLKTFGALLVTIVFMGGFALFLSKRPRNFVEAKAHIIESKRNFMSRVGTKFRRPRESIRDLSIHEGEEFDFQKIETAGNRDLVDF